MASEFIGCDEIQQVDPPINERLSFPALVSAVTGAEVSEAHDALRSRGLSRPDGSTPPMTGRTRLKIAGSVLEISPLEIAGEDVADDGALLGPVDEVLEGGRTVAVCRDPDAAGAAAVSPRWMLLTGYRKLDGEKDSIHTLDPSHEDFHYMGRHMVGLMFRGSAPSETAHAYALTLKPTRPAAMARAVRHGLAMFAEGFKYGGGGSFGY